MPRLLNALSNRWKLTVEYDGRPFMGWQRQRHGPSVQQSLEEALYSFTSHPCCCHAAGRTDSGVHACAQIVHCDLEAEWAAQTIRDATNFYLQGLPITVLSAEKARSDFDARFSAIARHYRYVILNRPARAALKAGYVWHIRKALDIQAMRLGAEYLVGRHDFSSFRGKYCQAKSPVKTLSSIILTPYGEELHIDMSAPSFLYHQVRNIVGTLQLVGIGKLYPPDMVKILSARDRSAAGMMAPAEGLYLIQIDYPTPHKATHSASTLGLVSAD